jgi:hypothetical protein
MLVRMLFSIALLLFVPFTALAQYTPKPSADQAKHDSSKTAPQGNAETSGKVLLAAVTGCLQKSDQPGEFAITGEDGKTWDLSSTTVKLAAHVGHQVTVTGSPVRETKAEEKKEGQVENAAGKQELGELRVTRLKMVSQSCAK